MNVYSTYQAKTRFSEILRKVRSGQRIWVTYHGQRVAEIRPIRNVREPLDDRIRRLETEGVLIPASAPDAGLRPLAKRPGALRRFLEERD